MKTRPRGPPKLGPFRGYVLCGPATLAFMTEAADVLLLGL